VGIKVDLAGSQRGVEDLPIRTGWVFYNFLSSTIVEYPTSVQTAKWTKDPNEGSVNNEEMSFNTKDGLTVYGDLSVSYHLDAAKVPAFYVKFRNDDIGQFTHGFLRNVARDAINRTGSQYTVQEIMGEKKSELEQNSRLDLQRQVADIGVVIDQFGFIGSPRPPQSVIDAINAVASRRREVSRRSRGPGESASRSRERRSGIESRSRRLHQPKYYRMAKTCRNRSLDSQMEWPSPASPNRHKRPRHAPRHQARAVKRESSRLKIGADSTAPPTSPLMPSSHS